MKLLGRDTGELRLPLCPLDAAGEAKHRTVVAELWAVESVTGFKPP